MYRRNRKVEVINILASYDIREIVDELTSRIRSIPHTSGDSEKVDIDAYGLKRGISYKSFKKIQKLSVDIHKFDIALPYYIYGATKKDSNQLLIEEYSDTIGKYSVEGRLYTKMKKGLKVDPEMQELKQLSTQAIPISGDNLDALSIIKGNHCVNFRMSKRSNIVTLHAKRLASGYPVIVRSRGLDNIRDNLGSRYNILSTVREAYEYTQRNINIRKLLNITVNRLVRGNCGKVGESKKLLLLLLKGPINNTAAANALVSTNPWLEYKLKEVGVGFRYVKSYAEATTSYDELVCSYSYTRCKPTLLQHNIEDMGLRTSGSALYDKLAGFFKRIYCGNLMGESDRQVAIRELINSLTMQHHGECEDILHVGIKLLSILKAISTLVPKYDFEDYKVEFCKLLELMYSFTVEKALKYNRQGNRIYVPAGIAIRKDYGSTPVKTRVLIGLHPFLGLYATSCWSESKETYRDILIQSITERLQDSNEQEEIEEYKKDILKCIERPKGSFFDADISGSRAMTINVEGDSCDYSVIQVTMPRVTTGRLVYANLKDKELVLEHNCSIFSWWKKYSSKDCSIENIGGSYGIRIKGSDSLKEYEVVTKMTSPAGLHMLVSTHIFDKVVKLAESGYVIIPQVEYDKYFTAYRTYTNDVGIPFPYSNGRLSSRCIGDIGTFNKGRWIKEAKDIRAQRVNTLSKLCTATVNGDSVSGDAFTGVLRCSAYKKDVLDQIVTEVDDLKVDFKRTYKTPTEQEIGIVTRMVDRVAMWDIYCTESKASGKLYTNEPIAYPFSYERRILQFRGRPKLVPIPLEDNKLICKYGFLGGNCTLAEILQREQADWSEASIRSYLGSSYLTWDVSKVVDVYYEYVGGDNWEERYSEGYLDAVYSFTEEPDEFFTEPIVGPYKEYSFDTGNNLFSLLRLLRNRRDNIRCSVMNSISNLISLNYNGKLLSEIVENPELLVLDKDTNLVDDLISGKLEIITYVGSWLSLCPYAMRAKYSNELSGGDGRLYQCMRAICRDSEDGIAASISEELGEIANLIISDGFALPYTQVFSYAYKRNTKANNNTFRGHKHLFEIYSKLSDHLDIHEFIERIEEYREHGPDVTLTTLGDTFIVLCIIAYLGKLSKLISLSDAARYSRSKIYDDSGEK